MTKSFERLSLHLNAGYEFLTDARRGERDGRYELVLGASVPVSAPRYTRATLVAGIHRAAAWVPSSQDPQTVPALLQYRVLSWLLIVQPAT